MYRSRVVVLLMVFSFVHSFAQDGTGRPALSEEERAARRAQFIQMMQQEGGAGGATSAAVRDQAVTTQRPAEGGQLETTRQATRRAPK